MTGSQDELFVCGKRVVWYSGLHPSSRVVKVSYTMETAVLQALWCLFEDGDKEGAWCVCFLVCRYHTYTHTHSSCQTVGKWHEMHGRMPLPMI